MKRLILSAAALVMSVACLSESRAAEESADPTGTWKWSVMFNNQTRELTLKLKLEGDKLTGAMIGRNDQETPIEDATFKDGEVAFSVTRERNGQKFTMKYKGKVSADEIKGTTEFEREGQTRTRDWAAKREKK